MNLKTGSSLEQPDRFGLDEIEWAFLVDRLGRPPSDIEGALYSILQGEELSHRSSRSLLDSFIAEELHLPVQSGIRIGTIKINDRLSLAVTVIDANRDLQSQPDAAVQSAISEVLLRLSALRARPLGMLPMLRTGPLDDVINQRLFQRITSGYSAHTNTGGFPVFDSDIFFHPRYQTSPLLNICAVGLVANQPGETALAPTAAEIPVSGPKTILYLGPPTGRENLLRVDKKGRVVENKGKTEKLARRSSPFALRNLLDCVTKMEREKLLAAVAPSGFGGLAVAFRNLALQLGSGFKVDLDRIPVSLSEIPVRDLLFSEGAERALIAFDSSHHRRVLGLLRQHQIPSVILGESDELESLRFEWNRRNVADLPLILLGLQSGRKSYQLVKFPPMLKQKRDLAAAPAKLKRQRSADQNEWGQVRDAADTAKPAAKQALPEPRNIEDSWIDLLADPNVVSREPFTSTFFQDLGGTNMLPFKSNSAVIRLRSPDSPAAAPGDRIAATICSSSLYMAVDSYLGAVHSVAEAVRNLAVVGATPIGICYNLNFGDPEDYREICDLSEAVRGIGDACKFWKIPIATETVSLFNGTEAVPILPTPTIYMFGTLPADIAAPGIAFRSRREKILILGNTKLEIESSEYAHYLHRHLGSKLPEINFEYEHNVSNLVRKLVNSKLLSSAAPVGRGGFAVALARCCMMRQPPIGAAIALADTLGQTVKRSDGLLFSETPGRFILSFKAEDEEKIVAICAEFGVPITGTGDVGGKIIELSGGLECQIPLSTAYRVWSSGLNYYLGVSTEEDAAAN